MKDSTGEEADKLRRSLQEILGTTSTQLQELLKRPPWGAGLPPTLNETIQNIQELANFIGLSEALPLKTPSIAIQKVQSYLKEQLNYAKDNEEIKKLGDELNHLEETKNIVKRDLKFLKQNAESINQLQKRLTELLQGKTLEQLKEELTKLDTDVKQNAILVRIYQDSYNYLKDTGLNKCPVCEVDCQDLCQRLSETTSTAKEENRNLIDNYQKTAVAIQEVEQLIQKINSVVADNEKLASNVKNMEKEIRLLLGLAEGKSIEDELIDKQISILNEKINSLRQKQQSHEQWCNEQAGRSEDFKMRFDITSLEVNRSDYHTG